MRLDIPTLLLVIALGVAGGVLLWRAVSGGGPLYYFVSAVCFGMAIAAVQGRSSRPSKGAGRRTGRTGGRR